MGISKNDDIMIFAIDLCFLTSLLSTKITVANL